MANVIKLKSYYEGDPFAVEEVSKSSEIMQTIINDIQNILNNGDEVVLDFSDFSPKNHFSSIGKLAYKIIYEWDNKKVSFNNMSAEALDYFISSVRLYNQTEVKLNENFVNAFNKYLLQQQNTL